MIKRLVQVLTGTLLMVFFAGGLWGNNKLNMTVFAAENEQRAVKETTDLKFLAHCDPEDLLSITVNETQAEEMQAVVDSLIAGAETDYDKAENIYEWVTKNIDYAYDHVDISADPYEVFVDGRGVCGGISNLYNELLHMAGVPSVAVAGYYTLMYAHQWNAVYADGRWFYADGTSSGLFDNLYAWDTHYVTDIPEVSIVADNLRIGYYQGVSVVGTYNAEGEITIPETFEDMPVTSVSYQLFKAENGVKIINIGQNVTDISTDTMVTSEILEQVNVSEENIVYASKNGVLYSKDMKELLAYPKGRKEKTYTLPKETIILDMKDAFGNNNLTAIEVEEGNPSYTSYDGALYNADGTELLFIPAGKTTVKIPAEAAISDMAFANTDRENLTIYGTPGSYAETFAGWYNITFVDIKEWEEPPVDQPEEPSVRRLYGSGRYDTAYAAADELKAVLGVEKFDAAVVATGKSFADALSGSYLAVQKNAPILLTSGKDDNVVGLHTYIRNNVKPGGTVYILGGEAAVPKSVELLEDYTVKRLSGSSRYETNIEILKEAGMTVDSVIVATGKNFADSLSASATKLPILLVKPKEELNDAQKDILTSMKNIYIAGGEGAVSKAYENELKAFGAVTRLSGKGRYQTSVEIASAFFKNADKAVAADGRNFPDGLCGGPLAAALNVPLILTKDENCEAAAAYMAEQGICSGYVLGGEGVLKSETVMNIFQVNRAEEIK